MSATARHRQNRMKNEDGVIVSNPSQISIPVELTQGKQTQTGYEALSRSQNKNYKERPQVDNKSDEEQEVMEKTPSGSFGKIVVFLAGTSVGVAASAFYCAESSLF